MYIGVWQEYQLSLMLMSREGRGAGVRDRREGRSRESVREQRTRGSTRKDEKSRPKTTYFKSSSERVQKIMEMYNEGRRGQGGVTKKEDHEAEVDGDFLLDWSKTLNVEALIGA
jgi:hypothetical protein